MFYPSSLLSPSPTSSTKIISSSQFSLILPFSKLGLSQEDQIYLKTIEDLIETRANLADQIMDYLKLEQNYETGNKVNFQQAQAANLFMREKYLSGIDRARSLANYNNQIIKREEMH